jgi:hypothetical protein
MSIQVLCLLLKRLFEFMSNLCFLYILDINPFSNVLFENNVSYTIICLFTLLIVTCFVQEIFSLMEFSLPICAPVIILKEECQNQVYDI